MTDVRVGSLVFRGGEGRYGFFIEKGGLTGWFDGPDSRADQTQIPQGNGDFDVPTFLGSRVISVSGLCYSEDARRMEHYQHQLTGLIADGGKWQLQVDGPSNTLWTSVRRFGQPQFIPEVWGERARYQVQFWAADPRKFGETRHFAAGDAAYHYGNFSAAPVLKVSGNMPNGYTINGPFLRKYTVTAPVSSGSSHVIDMSTGVLKIAGFNTYGVVTQADSWAVPPGQTVSTTLSPVSGSGTLDVVVTDTYV